MESGRKIKFLYIKHSCVCYAISAGASGKKTIVVRLYCKLEPVMTTFELRLPGIQEQWLQHDSKLFLTRS